MGDEQDDQYERDRRRNLERTVLLAIAVVLATAALTVFAIALTRTAGL